MPRWPFKFRVLAVNSEVRSVRFKIMNLDVIDQNKNKVASLDVSSDIFEKDMNKQLLYDVVKMQLANRRQGTAATKSRGMVRGGGKKPWRQKGTGRARAGTSRSPIWNGGGIVFGPQPRDYSIKLTKKVRKNALKVALSSKVKDNELVIVDAFSFDRPKTKDMLSFLSSLGVNGKAVIVTDIENENLVKSGANLPNVKIMNVSGVNVMDVLKSDSLIIDKSALGALQKRLS